ncbi:PQQ-binding-like beta-propeller repeat protein [Actinocorallia sp. B10E7]|uniref:outer membrane protein assembly factor BamB family protein n=1 Tax=Actinocorallia sp. B10E7 TaxID=3153558 RepID=UPI00325E62ED
MSLGAVLAGVAACSLDVAEPEPEPREGPPASWSMQGPTGMNTAVMIGRVLVVRNDEEMFGADPETGRKLWSFPSAGLRVSGDLIVLLEKHDRIKAFSVADPATGRILWRKDSLSGLRVAEDAIFTVTCRKDDECTTTRHDRRSGEPRWNVRSSDAWLGEDGIGARLPFVPATGSYLPAELHEDDQGFSVGARDAKSGRLTRGRITSGWHEVVVGRTLVSSEHDPPDGDDRCTVTLTAVNVESGRKKWKREVFSGREAHGGCRHWLADAQSGQYSFIGAGSRIAASTEDGYPQVFDLEVGRTVWRGDVKGVPIDGDGRTLLVRQHADQGSLTLLDFATGRQLWTAPDPGLEGSSASWQTAVTGRLVSVSGAVGTRPHVLVYRVEDGQRLGRFPGWLQGLGEDWAAIGHSPHRPVVGKLQFDFIRF